MTDKGSSAPLILVVDDEPTILRSITTALATEGFRVIVAENGAAGLETFLNDPARIDLVITDIVMPFMGGIEMGIRMRKVRPNVPILLISAYSDAVIDTFPGAGFPLIRKPFLFTDLLRTIHANLAPPAASA